MSVLLPPNSYNGQASDGDKLDVQAFPNFTTASVAALTFLREQLPFGLWVLTRARAEQSVVLEIAGDGFNIQSGDVLPWFDGLCDPSAVGSVSRFVPHLAERSRSSAATQAHQLGIAAYLSVPLTRCNGAVFGALCGMHFKPITDDLSAKLPMIELIARMLATLLEVELQATRQARLAERSRAEALTDSLTGLYNRRGWDQLMAAEDSRCTRYAHPACVLSIDLDDLKRVNDTGGHAAGDDLLRRTAKALQKATREHDVVARVGGDEFVVLGVEVEGEGEIALAGRIDNALAMARIRASIGLASRDPSHGLVHAWQLADTRMYAQKQRRKAPRTTLEAR